METYSLDLISPAGKVFSKKVVSFSAIGYEGSFGVFARHAPMVIRLKKGVVKINDAERDHYFAVNSGICEVTKDQGVLALVDEAIPAQDEADAQQKLAQFAG